jgi:hypothetical protein
MDSTTQSLESLLGILHSKNTSDANCSGGSTITDQTLLIQKLDSIERACASLHLLHDKVDSLCAGMQLIRAEAATDTLALTLAPEPPIATSSPQIRDSIQDLDVTKTPDFVTINVREDAPDDPVLSLAQSTDTSVAQALSLHEGLTPSPQEPEPDYANTVHSHDVSENDELYINRIRQEAELISEVD